MDPRSSYMNRLLLFCHLLKVLFVFYVVAGSGKTVLSCVLPSLYCTFYARSRYLPVHRSSKSFSTCVRWDWPWSHSSTLTSVMVASRKSATCCPPFSESFSSAANLTNLLKFSPPSSKITIVALANPAKKRLSNHNSSARRTISHHRRP